MSATTLTLTVEPGVLDARSSWAEFESLAVQMSREVPLRALEEALADAQERLIDSVCGPRWAPVRGLAAPFACPRCATAQDFARKGKRTRRQKLQTAAGVVELVLCHVGCRGCGRVFAPLLVMLGLLGKRRTDRLTVDLAELGTQVSFARTGHISRQLAGTTATVGQAHNAVADMAALLTGTDGTLGPGHRAPDVVAFDGTGARAGTNKNGVGVHLALGLTGRSGPAQRRRAHTHLLGLTVDEDWGALSAQLAGLPAPALVVLDGEAEITTLAQNLWPQTPIQRCWWHLPPGLRKAFYADDAANRHVNPRWARHMSEQLGELLRDTIRHEQSTTEALGSWDAFTEAIPDKLSSTHSYLASTWPPRGSTPSPAWTPTCAPAWPAWADPNWAPAYSSASCARSTPAPTSEAAAGAWPGYAICSPCTPHGCCTTPPGRRSTEPLTGPTPSHSACKSSTLDDATEDSAHQRVSAHAAGCAFDPMRAPVVVCMSSVHDTGGAHSVETDRLPIWRWP
jgi:hypothetical protein